MRTEVAGPPLALLRPPRTCHTCVAPRPPHCSAPLFPPQGLCLNLCKIPTQEFFRETLGMDVTFSPNFDTHECRLSFGMTPLPLEEDPDVPRGCTTDCTMGYELAAEGQPRTIFCSNK